MTPKPMQDYNYQIGGTVENTLIYVSRKADTKIQKELKAGNFCYILNARQMGKSSLREQTTEKLKTKTMICASFALKQSYSTKTQWYGGFIQDLMKSLNSQLPKAINWRDWWLKNKDLEEIERLKTFIEEVLLANIQQNIVIFIDEIDTILSLQFSLDEFWTLIRECYEQRPNNPEYKRLTFAVFGVSTPYELIRDKNLTVDIGTAIDLTGFTFEEAKPLAKGLKKKARDPEKVLQEIINLTGGQPFLTQKVCDFVGKSEGFIDAGRETEVVKRLVQSNVIENWQVKDEPPHFRTIRDRLLHPDNKQSLRSRLKLYRNIQQGADISADDSDGQTKLRLSGLTFKDQQGKLKVYNPIYKEIFNADWVKKELNKLVCTDWGEAPTVEHFYGREKELQDLEKWIVNDQSKVVAIVGIGGIGKTQLSLKLGKGGIGKTDLSQKLVHNIQGDFEYVIWRRLLNAPPLNEILIDIIQFLSGQPETNLPDSSKDKIDQLIDYLTRYRCLIILDNVESILKKGSDDDENNENAALLLETGLEAGQYRDGYDNYGQLFRQMGTLEHQSCLMLTSRVIPPEIDFLKTKDGSVRLLPLEGLKETETVRNFFKQFGTFNGSEQHWKELISVYEGNPLGLKLAAGKIQQKYEGDISQFLSDEEIHVLGSMKGLLDWHFEDLKQPEKELMYWLAINRESVSSSELLDDIISVSQEEQVQNILKSLEKKFLLETRKEKVNKFTIQPVLIEYMTKRFIEEIIGEIRENKIKLLDSHALLKAQGKDWVKNIQLNLILKPIIEQVIPPLNLLEEPIKILGDSIPKNQLDIQKELNQYHEKIKSLFEPLNIESYLTLLLSKLRKQFRSSGYVTGNIINLLIQYQKIKNEQPKPTLSQYDFSNLNVWQADFSQTSIHNVNFTQCNFKNCLFMDTFGAVLSVKFSPNGKFYAGCDTTQTIRIWSIENNQLVSECKGHNDYVLSFSFSPDSQKIASGSIDKTVKIWQVETGQCLRTMKKHTGWVQPVVFSPDGQKIASCSADGLRIWDINTKNCLDHWEGREGLQTVDFSPDGQTIIAGSTDKTLKIYNLATGECKQTLTGHKKVVGSVSFSPDGNFIASSIAEKINGHEEIVKIWQLIEGKWRCIDTLEETQASVRQLSFSPNSQQLVCCVCGYNDYQNNNPIKIYDIKSRQYKPFMTYPRWLMSAAFHPDGETLISSSEDEIIKLWNLKTGECLRTLSGHTDWQLAVAFHPNGQILASGDNNGTVRLWDVETGECLKALQRHTSTIWSLAFSPDGKKLASGSTDISIKIWDVKTGKHLKTLRGEEERFWSLAFSPDGKKLAGSSVGQIIRIWDIEQIEGANNYQHPILKPKNPGSGGIKSIAYSPDGQKLASGGEDTIIRIWDIKNSECLKVLSEHTDVVNSVNFIDEQTLVSGSEDGTIRIWNLNTYECHILHDQVGRISSLSVSSDGQKLVSASQDGTVRLWNLNTDKTNECKILEGHTSRVDSVVFSPSDKTIASCGRDGTIQLWDVETGEHETLRIDRPYERMNITGVEGLNDAEKAKLIALGAVSR